MVTLSVLWQWTSSSESAIFKCYAILYLPICLWHTKKEKTVKSKTEPFLTQVYVLFESNKIKAVKHYFITLKVTFDYLLLEAKLFLIYRKVIKVSQSKILLALFLWTSKIGLSFVEFACWFGCCLSQSWLMF